MENFDASVVWIPVFDAISQGGAENFAINISIPRFCSQLCAR